LAVRHCYGLQVTGYWKILIKSFFTLSFSL
jgi:hypothetical protein